MRTGSKRRGKSPLQTGAATILLNAERITEALGDGLKTEKAGGEVKSPCARPQLAFTNPLTASIGINVLNTVIHRRAALPGDKPPTPSIPVAEGGAPLVTFEGQNEYHYWLKQTVTLASGAVANPSTREQRRCRRVERQANALAAAAGTATSSAARPSASGVRLTKRERARAARRRRLKKGQPLVQPPMTLSTRKITRFEIQAAEARTEQAWYTDQGLYDEYRPQSDFQPREDHPEKQVGKEFRTVFHLPDNIDYQLQVARAQEGFLAGKPILHIPRSFSPARWIQSVEGKPDFDLVPRHTSSKEANQELRKATLRDLGDFWFDEPKFCQPMNPDKQATAAAASRSQERRNAAALASGSSGEGSETQSTGNQNWKMQNKKISVSELRVKIPVPSEYE